MWPTVSPGTETRGKKLRKSKTKKTLHGLRNRLLKKSQYQIVDSRLLMQTPPPTKTPSYAPFLADRRTDGPTDTVLRLSFVEMHAAGI